MQAQRHKHAAQGGRVHVDVVELQVMTHVQRGFLTNLQDNPLNNGRMYVTSANCLSRGRGNGGSNANLEQEHDQPADALARGFGTICPGEVPLGVVRLARVLAGLAGGGLRNQHLAAERNECLGNDFAHVFVCLGDQDPVSSRSRASADTDVLASRPARARTVMWTTARTQARGTPGQSPGAPVCAA